MTIKSFLLFFSLLFSTTTADNRNLEYKEKNDLKKTADAFAMTPVVPPCSSIHKDCTIFRNASDFIMSLGIVLVDVDDCHHQHIGWLDEGDWLAYALQVPWSGVYEMKINVASPLGEGGFRIENYETQYTYATVETLSATNDWDSYNSVTVALEMVETGNNSTLLLIRSLAAGWTFRDFCLDLNDINNNNTTTAPVLNATTETFAPTMTSSSSVASSARPSLAPTFKETVASEIPSFEPTVVVSSEIMPSSSFTPTFGYLQSSSSTETTVAMPSLSPTMLIPSYTYQPSLSDTPSSVPSVLGKRMYRKKSSKRKSSYTKGSSTETALPSPTTLEPSSTYQPSSFSDAPSSVPTTLLSKTKIPVYKKNRKSGNKRYKKGRRSRNNNDGKGSRII